MPESPPKRITRARAKAAEKEPDTKGAKAAKVATSTKPTRTTKRKTRADDVEDQAMVIGIPTTAVEKPEPAKTTKSRSRRVAPSKVETAEETMVTEPMEPPKTTRGRSRKAAASTTKPEGEPEKLEVVRTKRGPRGRAATAAAATAAVNTTTKAPTKSAVPKKKVTFQDDLDKENIVPSSDEFKQPSPKKLPEKATGLRAKPVRRPAPGRATRSSKKAEAEKPEEKGELPPLSPKKAKQIPLIQPTSDEDELSGGKTPRKAFGVPSCGIASIRAGAEGKSASKPGLSTSLVALRQEKLSTADLLSSSKGLGSSLLGTPARRPPSPVKGMLGESTLKSRGGSVQPSLIAPPSTFRNSTLQSPARRPIHSPTKIGIASGSPRKFIPTSTSTIEPSEASSNTAEFKVSTFSPPKASSPLRATKPPEHLIKVHKMSIEEQFEQEDIVQKSSYPLLSAIELDPNRKKTPIKSVAFKLSPAKSIKSSIPIKNPPASPRLDDFVTAIDSNEATKPAVVERSTTPPGIPTQPLGKAFYQRTPTATRQVFGDSDTEDDFQSESQDHSPTPFSHQSSVRRFGSSSIPTPSNPSRKPKSTPMRGTAEENILTSTGLASSPVTCIQPSQIFSMTPLASQFGNLAVVSPNKLPQGPVQTQRGLFSPAPPKPSSSSIGEVTESTRYSILKSSFFDDEMLAFEQQEEVEEPAPTEVSEASQEYGDENVVPTDSRHARNQALPAITTPVKIFSSIPQEIRTVQKVPLKPAADDMPTASRLKRSASLSGLGSPRKEFIPPRVARIGAIEPLIHENAGFDQQSVAPAQAFCTPTKPILSPQRTPGTAAWSNFCSPARTPRRYVDPEILKGAVVHVDVHTAEGSDASGIFVELLTQMGARCVKQWNWNPNSNTPVASDVVGFGIGGSDDGIRDVGTPGGSKIGITHVVFKDGGVRTLQRVRESKGVVVCVGVNWVLDCEREQKWLDEADYAVDISSTPRGGHRRRKSMEPRALANINGNLVPCDSPAARVSMSPTKEFLTFSSPPAPAERSEPAVPTTPLQQITIGSDEGDMSPTTPYFLKPMDMVQRTCPPKTLGPGKLLVMPTGEDVRQRLLLARRKSLQWAPKVGSPLGKGMSFGV